MADNTSLSLRHMHIYSLFTRNFSDQGNFAGVAAQLDRIKALGVDMIWFLPFYQNGDLNKKGSLGSPYAIKDYYQIDPQQGSLEDFQELVDQIHQRDMRVMIDIVFNHTAPDSLLSQEHPDWFYHTPEGNFGNRVGDWSDVIDLDFAQPGLWDYLIEVLKFWAQYVDGFRCDVAPLVPLEFWQRARKEVETVKPGIIWLAESVEPSFIKDLRARDMTALSDSQIYQAFDMAYDYDVRHHFEAYLRGEITLRQYTDILDQQDTLFPANYAKLRNLENHDRDRIASLVTNKRDLAQWTAFNFFQKGPTLTYNGQEVLAQQPPSLFDPDPIDWQGPDNISDDLAKLARLKKEYLPVDNWIYSISADEETDTIIASYIGDQEIVGVFNVKEANGQVAVPLTDGSYLNLLTDEIVDVANGQMDLQATPSWLIKKG